VYQNLDSELFHNVDLTNTSFHITAYYRTLQQVENYEIEDINDDITKPFNISDPDSIKVHLFLVFLSLKGLFQ